MNLHASVICFQFIYRAILGSSCYSPAIWWFHSDRRGLGKWSLSSCWGPFMGVWTLLSSSRWRARFAGQVPRSFISFPLNTHFKILHSLNITARKAIKWIYILQLPKATWSTASGWCIQQPVRGASRTATDSRCGQQENYVVSLILKW